LPYGLDAHFGRAHTLGVSFIMLNRKLLNSIVIGMVTVGLCIAALPFILSMNPNAKHEAALPRLDISTLKIGDVVILDIPEFGLNWGGYTWAAMLFKRKNGEISAFTLPVKDGAVGLPDMYWYRPYWPCVNFGPTKVDGVIDEQQPIQCHDSRTEQNQWYQFQWDIEGKSKYKYAEDMWPTEGEVENGYFVVGKS